METPVKVNSISAVIEIFKLQSRLFNNVIDELTDQKSDERVGKNTNSVKWIAGHLVNSRYMIANLCGVEDQDPNDDLFGHGKGIQEEEYPSIVAIREQWNAISPKMLSRMEMMSEEDLSKDAPFQLPIEDRTIRGVFAFFAHHEAYHIGQIGIARKYLGYDSMKYS